MSHAQGPTLRLYLWIVVGSFAAILGSVWFRASYPDLATHIWFWTFEWIGRGFQSFVRFSDTQLGYYVWGAAIFGLLAFFVIGIVLITYEELIESP